MIQNVANNPKTVFLDNQNIATEIIHTLFDEAICKHSQAKCIFITVKVFLEMIIFIRTHCLLQTFVLICVVGLFIYTV